MAVLMLRLAGPMQSWGCRSRYDHRDTRGHPTLSGVVGLCAAALGRSRDDDVSDLAALRMGTRADQPGTRARDYQTVFYAEKSKTFVTHRYYLEDAVFVVGLEGDREFLEMVAAALERPVFAPFLGRRGYVPSHPLVLEIVDMDLDQALREYPYQAAPWWAASLPGRVRVDTTVTARPGEPGDVVADIPLSFTDRARVYDLRTVVSDVVEVENPHSHASAVPDRIDPFTML